MSLDTPALDVRRLPPQQRHATIFATFESLPPGGSLELHNDHDPMPLRAQFLAQWPGQFNWEYLEAGPALWRVRITRQAAGKSCCGCCSG
ncbi:MAG: DUF2249 domain-containing protein [Burkholderiaceae bacterium]